MKGHLIWFNPAKRHGFIRTEEGERLLVEESGFEAGHVLGDRCAGTPLTFERQATHAVGDARAVRVSVIPVIVPRSTKDWRPMVGVKDAAAAARNGTTAEGAPLSPAGDDVSDAVRAVDPA